MKTYYCKSLSNTLSHLEIGFVVVAENESAAKAQAFNDIKSEGWDLDESHITLKELNTSVANTVIFDPSN